MSDEERSTETRRDVLMPLPHARDAPRFDGTNLRRFLCDYEKAAKIAGWSQSEMCSEMHRYCKTSEALHVDVMEEAREGDWEAMKETLELTYTTEEVTKKYTRTSIENFARQRRSITKYAQFSSYQKEFNFRTNMANKRIARDDRDAIFWEGLPDKLREGVLAWCRDQGHRVDTYDAPKQSFVVKAARVVLDKDSIYGRRMSRATADRRTGGRASLARRASRGDSETETEPDSDYESSSDGELAAKRASEKRKRHSKGKGRGTDSESRRANDSGSDRERSETESDSDGELSAMKKQRKDIEKKRRRLELKGEIEEERAKLEKVRKAAKTPPKKDASDVDVLTNQLEKLKIMHTRAIEELAAANVRAVAVQSQASSITEHPDYQKFKEEIRKDIARGGQQQNQSASAPPRQNARNRRNDDANMTSRTGGKAQNGKCFMCKESDTHERGISNCPEAKKLAAKGLIVERNGRYRLPDGSDLPRASQPLGPIIEAMSNNQKTRQANFTRISARGIAIPPSNYVARQASPSATTFATSAYHDRYDASTSTTRQAFGAEQSEPRQTRKDVRFDPHATEGRNKRVNSPGRHAPEVVVPAAPREWGKRNSPSPPATNSRPQTPIEKQPAPSQDRMDIDKAAKRMSEESRSGKWREKGNWDRSRFEVRDDKTSTLR